jgi:hypothetical protein
MRGCDPASAEADPRFGSRSVTRQTAIDELGRLDRIFRERGATTSMIREARALAADLEVDPPAWAAADRPEDARQRRQVARNELRRQNGDVPHGTEWHRRRADEQLQREWERWRYRRSKLPPDQRGRMMEPGQRECRWCDGFFWPSTLRQRYCTDSCRKLAHKRRRKGAT